MIFKPFLAEMTFGLTMLKEAGLENIIINSAIIEQQVHMMKTEGRPMTYEEVNKIVSEMVKDFFPDEM